MYPYRTRDKNGYPAFRMRWEYTATFASTGVGHAVGDTYAIDSVSASNIWSGVLKGNDGKTSWDQVKAFGQQGWELVSVTAISDRLPFTDVSYTKELLFCFKRPVPE